MSAASELFAKARAALLVGAPFWGVLSLRLAPIEDASIETMATDGVSIRFNPEFVAGLSRGALRTVIAHETMHCAALHHTRRGERNPRRWNVACDHAINPLLAAAGFELPDGALLDPAYAGMSAEEIYPILPDDAGENGGGQNGDDPGGMGGVNDPPPGSDEAGDAGQPGQPGGQAPSPADLARQEENWTIAAAQAEATANSMGVAAGDAARAIREQVAPKVGWRDVLRRYLSAAAKSDYAWTPPNRRYIARGLYLPSLRSETSAPSSSPSIPAAALMTRPSPPFPPRSRPYWTRRHRRRFHVVYCDAAVKGTEDFEAGDVIRLTPKGGGGTAFRPVFEWVAESDVQPVCAIYLTDLDGRDFGEPPDYPVLWVSTWKTVAPFGEVIPLR